jgi:hypothetical protein
MDQSTSSPGQNTSINLHQQKLYCLIIAAVAFIGMILPWTVTGGGFGGLMPKQTSNGFGGWGILALFGVAGVVVSCLLGDKTKVFDQTFRYVAIGSFVAIILGAFIPFMQIMNAGGLGVKSGIGIWFCIIAGIVGLLWVSGVIKFTPAAKVPGPPPPPPPAR